MGHTNSTTNYSLPQFLSTDKPAWLTDINSAFSAIDTAVKNAKDAGDNAQGDATQALTDAGNALTAANTADVKGGGAVSSIAATFDSTSTYTVGQLVMYNSLLYICHTAITTPGAWTGSANWSRTTIENITPRTLGSIPDVSISGADANDVLTYDEDTGDWINKSFDTLGTYHFNDLSSAVAANWNDMSSVAVNAMQIGNIGIITFRFKTTAAISNGSLTLSVLPWASPREIWSSLSSLDGKGGFISLNGKNLIVRCGNSSDQYLAGQLVVPIHT